MCAAGAPADCQVVNAGAPPPPQEALRTAGPPANSSSTSSDASPRDGAGQGDPSSKTEAAASLRNENIYIVRIDNNALREALVRLGASITPIDEPRAGTVYYAAEFGRSPSEFPYLKPRAFSGWHGELYETHQNSVFNARTFFQAGPVKPSHQNLYGFLIGTPLWKRQALSIDGSQRKIRGMVNGNVLVPTPEEREPRTSDPAARAIITRFLKAFPAELPNRTEFDPRALNTNAPQMINEDRLGARWDAKLWRGRQIWTQYQYNNKFVDAFQFVAGQNPDTTLRSQQAQITLAQTLCGQPELSAIYSAHC